MLVRLALIFLLPFVASANFSDSDVGRSFFALIDKSGRGLVEGNIYQITEVRPPYHAIHTGGGVGIHYNHKGYMWDFENDYTMNQQAVETIAFLTGTFSFLIFARGFNTPLAL